MWRIWIWHIVAIILATYVLHFAWEIGHGSLFAPMDRMPFWKDMAWCARAAGWDVVISAVAYFAASLAERRLLWIRQRAWGGFAIYVASGLAVTTAIERWAVGVGRWQYREAMPTMQSGMMKGLGDAMAGCPMMKAGEKASDKPAAEHKH